MEMFKGFFELDIRTLMIRFNHAVNFMQVFIQFIGNLRESISSVHPPPVVWLQGPDVEARLVIPHREEVVQPVMREWFARGGGTVPGSLQNILIIFILSSHGL